LAKNVAVVAEVAAAVVVAIDVVVAAVVVDAEVPRRPPQQLLLLQQKHPRWKHPPHLHPKPLRPKVEKRAPDGAHRNRRDLSLRWTDVYLGFECLGTVREAQQGGVQQP
jgi:hypothetical protein